MTNGKEIFQVGDIVFERTDTITSKLIRMRTLSQWSHVGIIIGRVHGAVKVVSARRNGVIVDTLRDWGNKVQVLRLDPEVASEYQLEQMTKFAIQKVGKKYDYCGILDFITMTRYQNDNRWFCSELVHSSMLSASIDIFKKKKPPEFVTPGILYENPYLNYIAQLGDR
jgi:uncharacterized protein YycO